MFVVTLPPWGEKVRMFTHTYVHTKTLEENSVVIYNRKANSRLYVWLLSDLVTSKRRTKHSHT